VRDVRVPLLIAALASAAIAAACSLRGAGVSPTPVGGDRAAGHRITSAASPSPSPTGSASPSPSPSPSSSPSPPPFGYWLYTCSGKADECPVYSVSGTTLKYVKSVSSLSEPAGGAAAPRGIWYVAELSASKIAVFKSTKTGPSGLFETLADTGQYPVDVAVNAKNQIVAVSNEETTKGGQGSVTVYLNGAKSPTSTLTYRVKGSFFVGVGITTDAAGDCFWGVDDAELGGSSVIEFAKCAGAGTVVVSGITQVGGLAMDEAGDLYFVDEASGVYRCTLLASCSEIATGFIQPTMIRFDSNWTNLWLTDLSAATIYALDPSTGATRSTTPEHGGSEDAAEGLILAPGPEH
jgi:hypothetical protein